MYSDKRNIQQLAALLQAHGVEDIVVCPGSRNAALVHTFSQMGSMRCRSVTDERSAGFQAIGLSLATDRPVAVCITSGSAVANVHPAVCEAFYQGVPLVVISADRPQAWIGQMDGQTMPQQGVFGPMVRRSVSLPEVHTAENDWHCNRLINEALLEATHGTGGPVHINVPVSEPFYEFHTPELPPVRVIRRSADVSSLARRFAQASRPMIVVGQYPRPLRQLPKGCVMVSEQLGNQREGIRGDLDNLIASIPENEKKAYVPDLVISLGGHLVSKCMKAFLRGNAPREHWDVNGRGEVRDTFQCLTTIVECGEEELLDALDAQGADHAFTKRWNALALKLKTEGESVVGSLIRLLPEGAVLHLANSSAVRMAEHHRIRPDVTVCCNRGINGIEGSTSTAVGYALAHPERPNYLITGDLAFFYDQNALWSQPMPQNLHILLLNNGGGGIFDRLPLPQDERSQAFIRGRHTTSAEPVCRQYGVRYLQGEERMKDFAESREAVVLEIKTT